MHAQNKVLIRGESFTTSWRLFCALRNLFFCPPRKQWKTPKIQHLVIHIYGHNRCVKNLRDSSKTISRRNPPTRQSIITGQQNSSHLMDHRLNELILPILGVLNPNLNSEFIHQVSVLRSKLSQISVSFIH